MVAVSRGAGIELLRRDGGGELRAGRVLGKVRITRPQRCWARCESGGADSRWRIRPLHLGVNQGG